MALLSDQEVRAAAIQAAAISVSVEQRNSQYPVRSPSTEDIITRAAEFEKFIRNGSSTRRM